MNLKFPASRTWAALTLLLVSAASAQEAQEGFTRRYLCNFSLELPSAWLPHELKRGQTVSYGMLDETNMMAQAFFAEPQIPGETDEKFLARTLDDLANNKPPGGIVERTGPDPVKVGGLDAVRHRVHLSAKIPMDGKEVPMVMAGEAYFIQTENPEQTRLALLFMGANAGDTWPDTVAKILSSFSPGEPPLKFARRFGAGGEAPGQFKRPSCLASAPDGTLHMLDRTEETYGARIITYSSDGVWLEDFILGAKSEKENDPGQVFLATSMVIDVNTNFYVADSEGVKLFGPDRKFIRALVQSEERDALRVARDARGNIFLGGTGAKPRGIAALGPEGPGEILWKPEFKEYLWAPGLDGELAVLNENDGQPLLSILKAGGGVRLSCNLNGTVPAAGGRARNGLAEWEPAGLEVDAAGRVYVLDSESEALHIFAPEGALLAQIGPYIPGGEMVVDRSRWSLDSVKLTHLDAFGNVFVFCSGYSTPTEIWQFKPSPAFLQSAPAHPQPPPRTRAPLTQEELQQTARDEQEFWAIVTRVRGKKSTEIHSDISRGLTLADRLLLARPGDTAIPKGQKILREATP